MSIVFDGYEDEKKWCDPPCDALLIERKDGSHLCSYCGREYLPDSVNKHKSKLRPDKSAYENDGPELITLDDYTTPRKKKPTQGDIEDRAFTSKKSGLSITSYEEYLPDRTDKSESDKQR